LRIRQGSLGENGEINAEICKFLFPRQFQFNDNQDDDNEPFSINIGLPFFVSLFLYIFFVSAWGKLLSAEPLTPRPPLQGEMRPQGLWPSGWENGFPKNRNP